MSFSKRLLDKVSRSIRSFLYALHLESLCYAKRKNRDVVLMYHNVFETTRPELNLRNISQDDLRRTLRYLKRNYDVVSLRELMTKQSHAPRIAITFDDGLVNNLRFALPVIEEVKVPVTFFVTTSWLIGESTLWPDRLSFVLQFVKGEIHFDGRLFRRFYKNQFKSADNLETLESALLKFPLPEIDRFITQLESQCMADISISQKHEHDWIVMKGEEIKILSSSAFVEIGSHGVSHQNLTLLSKDDIYVELKESKTYLERACGKSIDMFAFPFGLYNDIVLDACNEVGYSLLAGVALNNDVHHRNAYLCSRVGLYNDSSVTEQLHHINSLFE